MAERKRFLFEPPQWHHVVHGADEQLKFVERDQTRALAQDVREQLIAPLLRGTGSLSALFVTGPPGAGKSTIVRRVAVQLIEAGEVVVADAGHNLANIVPGGVEPYVQHLVKLAQQGRPVLLLLDDPLKAGSEWIELIKHLKRPGLRLAVIAPTPDFSYHSHQYALRGMQIHTFKVDPPSMIEKQAFARLYGRALNQGRTLSDDFLVMVAEAAEGKPFPEIMQRLWETLNGGHGVSRNAPFKDLPWQVRAFWFVSALHRAHVPCPVPILRESLEMSGGTGGLDVSTSLAKLESQGGWSIFHIQQPTSTTFKAAGALASTAHQQIAAVAWEERPGDWLDGEVSRLLAAATVRAPASVLYVAAAAGTLTNAKPNPDSRLADELIQQWTEAAAKDPNLETRSLSTLAANLMISGGREIAQRMSASLQQRANGHDGWLAALQLHYLSADKGPVRSFSPNINLGALVADADFSIAPNRATKFFNAVREKKHREVIVSRLCASLCGTLAWRINSTLLVWLISHAHPNEMIHRLGLLQEWLDEHKDDAAARTQFLSFLMKLAPEFADQRKNAVGDTESWLAEPQHDEDTVVRTQYLAFLIKLPLEFAVQRKSAATATESWLARHDEDTVVRAQYLAFLMKLPPEFADQRKNAARDTESWLAEPRHDEDTYVRTQYLAFLMKLPPEFANQRKSAATATESWLARHDENTDVRTQYLAFLMKLPSEFADQREDAARDTESWLAEPRHDEDTTVRTQYLAFVQQFPPELDQICKRALLRTAEWLKMHPETFDVCTGYVNLLLAVRFPDLAALEEESVPYHQWIIAKNPVQVGYRFTFGEQLLRLGKHAEAKAEYEQVLAQAPRHQLAHRGLAIAMQNLGKSKIAEYSFKRALYWAKKYGGQLAIFQTSLGMFYLGEKRWPEAIKSFEEARSEYPDHYSNHWGIAKAQVGRDDLNEALLALKQALADPRLRSPDKDAIEQMLADISQRIAKKPLDCSPQ